MKKTVYVNLVCTVEEKLRWLVLGKQLGYKSLSALVRAALTQMEDQHGSTPRGPEAQ